MGTVLDLVNHALLLRSVLLTSQYDVLTFHAMPLLPNALRPQVVLVATLAAMIQAVKKMYSSVQKEQALEAANVLDKLLTSALMEAVRSLLNSVLIK